MRDQLTFLCVCCEFKGSEFLEEVHALGHRVYLVTSQKTENDPWPRHCLEDIFYMPESDGRKWDMNALITGTAFLFRNHVIDKVIALDDYDVWKVAQLREEFRLPGMGQTTSRHFFDKLAMRMIARESEIPIPDFTGLFNDDQIRAFFDRTPGPYIVKPRSDAGALGIRKLENQDAFWEWNESHLEERYKYLIEAFKPGHVYHVDALFTGYEPLFMRSSRYLQPPFEIAHGGGVFRSQSLSLDDADHIKLRDLNSRLLKAFGLRFGVSHSEFIKRADNGEFVFLETSARVGGASLSDMVEAASGVNLWREWARIEAAMMLGEKYEPPIGTKNNAGIVVTLSRFEYPDYGPLDHPSICWRMKKKNHVGLIVRDPSSDRVHEILDELTGKIFRDYHASVPLKE